MIIIQVIKWLKQQGN